MCTTNFKGLNQNVAESYHPAKLPVALSYLALSLIILAFA
jgi:hypothetical protein